MTPCRGRADREKFSAVFARVAARLAELMRISVGQPADRTFDAMLCPVPAGDVATWQPPLLPGHWAAFTFYGTRAFEPLLSLYFARRHRYSGLPEAERLPVDAFPWQVVNTAEGARSFLTGIGLAEIRVYAEQLGYHLGSAGEWWEVLSHLPVEQRDRLNAEHLAEVASLTEGGPIWVELPVIFAIGCRPQG